jgi:acetyltransferase-like isoleucine patch superfamily enzyme
MRTDPDGINSTNTLITGETTAETPVRIAGSCHGRVQIGAFTYVNGAEISEARIGRFCSIAPGTIIGPGEHPTNFLSTHPFVVDVNDQAGGLSRNFPPYVAWTHLNLENRKNTFPGRGTIEIGNDVWIGTRAIILKGVRIGTGAIIAAGAVVTKDVDPYAVMAGVPAKMMKYRFDRRTRNRLLESEWWDFDLPSIRPMLDYTDVQSALNIIERAKADGVGRIQVQTYEITAGTIKRCVPLIFGEPVIRRTRRLASLRRLFGGST